MPGYSYSPAAVGSACEAISHRVISTHVELDHIVKTVDPASYKVQQLLALSGSLTQLKDAVEHLREAISGAAVVSRHVQDLLAESIEPCSHASAVVEKQIRRLDPGFDIETLDVKIVSEFAAHQIANARLFTLVADLLQIPEPDAQTARLVALRGRSVLDEAVAASSQVLKDSEVVVSVPSPTANVPPPEYSSATSPGGSSGSSVSAGKKKASGGFFSSLSHSLKAVTSTLMPKPDPLVVAMCQSAKAGNVAHMKAFIAQGVNINGQDEEGYTPLICAARANQMESVQFLIAAGANRAAKDSYGGKRKSALFHAAECGHLALAEALLNAGADVRERSWSGQPQFVEVANSTHLDIIKLFLERGADANTTAISGRTIFIHALQAGSLDHIRLLQRHGGDVNAKDITGQPGIHIALAQNRLDIVDFLLSCGADANATDITGNSMLHQAVGRRNLTLTKSLLAHGANPNAYYNLGKTLLHRIVDNSTPDDNTESELARLVLEKGADPNMYDSWGEPLFCHALEKGNTALIRTFLELRVNPNIMFRRQETTLLYTLSIGRIDHARLLLKHGADPNKPNTEGKTPLVEALLLDDSELVSELLDKGADISLAGSVKPAMLTKILTNKKIIKMLVAKGAEKPPPARETPPAPAAGPSRPAAPVTEDETLPAYSPQ